MEPCPIGCVQQETEFIEMIVHVLHQFHCPAVGIFRHVRTLRSLVHVIKCLLYFEKALDHFVQNRLDNGGKQPLLVLKTDIDGVRTRFRCRCDHAQRGVGIALIQKFLFGTVQNPLGNALDLLCHTAVLLFIHNTVS